MLECSAPKPAKDCLFQGRILSGKPLELFQIHRVSLDSTTFAKCVARPPEGRVKVHAENSDGWFSRANGDGFARKLEPLRRVSWKFAPCIL